MKRADPRIAASKRLSEKRKNPRKKHPKDKEYKTMFLATLPKKSMINLKKKASKSFKSTIIRVPRVNNPFDMSRFFSNRPYRVMGKKYNFRKEMKILTDSFPSLRTFYEKNRKDSYCSLHTPHEKFRKTLYAILRYGLAFGFSKKTQKEVKRVLQIYNRLHINLSVIGRIVYNIKKVMDPALVMKGDLKQCIRIPSLIPREEQHTVTLGGFGSDY